MIILINPNLVVQRNDPFTTGIVYMPIGLAYFAASLLKARLPVKVIDSFAERPYQARRIGKFLIIGLTYTEIIEKIPCDTKAIFVYAINLTNHLSTIGIIKKIKSAHPGIPVIVLENPHAVTAYALGATRPYFHSAGADFILTGEGELNGANLIRLLLGSAPKEDLLRIERLGTPDFYNESNCMIKDLDQIPFPAWDYFPLQSYWNLRFAHGPLSTKRYLPLLTSRGCPYSCRFCVAPATSNSMWRSRSAQNVVDEIEYFVHKYNVFEYHIEDINPTVSDRRIRDICKEISKRRLNIIWKIASGTKVETIRNEETIELMAAAGCRYISISPETGSPRLLKKMRKPFNLGHAVRLVRKMNQTGIHSQACFVLGFPGEKQSDLKMTWQLVKQLTRSGVDEIALFIISPVPGSDLYQEYNGYHNLSELNFSPTWRDDYKYLNRFRLNLYAHFLLWKIRHQPRKFIVQPIHFLKRRFEEKMEMVPYRAMLLKGLDSTASIFTSD